MDLSLHAHSDIYTDLRTLRLAALIEWETEIRQASEAVLFYLENDENNALRFSHGFAVDFETLK